MTVRVHPGGDQLFARVIGLCTQRVDHRVHRVLVQDQPDRTGLQQGPVDHLFALIEPRGINPAHTRQARVQRLRQVPGKCGIHPGGHDHVERRVGDVCR